MASKARRTSLIIFCTFLLPLLFLTDVHAAGCSVSCQLTAATNIPSGDATVWVLVDNTNYTVLPSNFSFAKGTTHTIQILNQTLLGASSGARYVWKQWSLNNTGNLYTASPTLNTPSMVRDYTAGQAGEFIAEYTKQFKLTLSFSDPSGQPVSPPTSVTLQSGAAIMTDSSYSGQWLDAKAWNVANATWEGDPNMESGIASFDLSAGPVTGTLMLKAYTATISVVDSSLNPIPSATVSVTFANGTVRSTLSDSSGMVQLGHIPLGPYTVQVNYQGQNEGNWSADAASTPILTTVLNVGGTQEPPPLTPFSALRTYWYFIALGFVAGFAGVAGIVRLRGKKTGLPGNLSSQAPQRVRTARLPRVWPGLRSSLPSRHQRRPCPFSCP